MPAATLLNLAGIAAVIVGGLRTVGAFVPETVPLSTREPLFSFTDIFILFALFGLYARIHREAGWIGLCGFVFGVVGIGVILAPDATIVGVPIYPSAPARSWQASI